MLNSVVGVEEVKVAPLLIGLIFGGLFLVLGLIAFKRMLSDQIKARRGTHPILEAIREGDRDFLVCVYIEQVKTVLDNGSGKIDAGQNVNYFTRDCKGMGKTIMTGRICTADELVAYLCTEFDIPYLDLSDSTRAALNKRFGTTKL